MGVDFKSLDIGAARPATVGEVELAPFKNGNGKPLVMSFLPMTSPEGRREMRKWRIKYAGVEAGENLTEDQLDALADKDEESAIDLVARMICGWNLETAKGAKIACDMDTRLEFLRAYPVVADAAAGAMRRTEAALGNSKAN
jgi:hypothetical protein